ncbi:MAG: stage II sporulation protein M [Gemmatimonadaceae bacterium]
MPDPLPIPSHALPDFRLRLEVETPEHVVVDYELAGLGSRALAAFVDTGILLLLVIAAFLVSGSLAAWFESLSVVLMVTLPFALIWGYFTLFEGLRQGQTPGKRLLGLRVIRDSGHAITMREAMARNLLRFADFLPPPYLLGILMIAFHPRAKRLGDIVAGTVVVRDRPLEPLGAGFGETAPRGAEELGPPQLLDQEFRVVREFVERAAELDPEIRARFAGRLVASFGARFPTRHPVDVTFITDLYRKEVVRRQGRTALPGSSNMASPTESIAERLVARKGGRWREFGALATRANETGLEGLEASELPDFAARYREVAADFARARTYNADPRTVLRLARLVAAGHNLLYRDERHTFSGTIRFLVDECPAAVVRAWRPVAIAMLVFSLSALGGYRLLRDQPAIAEEVLPAVILQRAADGAEEIRKGRGYAQAEAKSRPIVAVVIITNNLKVSFVCFATGIFLGVGSFLAVAFNGLLLGAISGHFQNSALLSYLWTFIAGHGVLELFAIFVATAAGFLMGSALIAPGDYSRRDALVLRGRLAIPMVTFTIVLLLIAGTVEGLVSTSGASVGVRLTITALSALFLILYLRRGVSVVRRAAS